MKRPLAEVARAVLIGAFTAIGTAAGAALAEKIHPTPPEKK